MKEKEIKVLKVKPHEHPEVYMLKNTLEAQYEELDRTKLAVAGQKNALQKELHALETEEKAVQ